MSRTNPEHTDVRLTIDTEDELQRWRYRCPKGHTSWVPTNYHFWCSYCSRDHDPEANPEFRELVDKKTGERYSREEVKLEGYRKKTH